MLRPVIALRSRLPPMSSGCQVYSSQHRYTHLLGTASNKYACADGTPQAPNTFVAAHTVARAASVRRTRLVFVGMGFIYTTHPPRVLSTARRQIFHNLLVWPHI